MQQSLNVSNRRGEGTVQLSELNAIVTGGASGLGEATTRKIVAAGGKVAVYDLNEEKAHSLIDELGSVQCI